MNETKADTPLCLEEQLARGAMALPQGQSRSDFLIQNCGDDIELHSRIEHLMEEIESRPGELGETSAGEPSNGEVSIGEIVVGSHIGPYKLLQQIGIGGMGVVFMADQSRPVRRKVALKIIKLGMDTRNVIARFEAERQALAMMDHPNITKVFDAGCTESGRPYFAMELVTGMAITDYCDKNQLSLEKRLKLFLNVCNGVQHAHQKGIIHRDLKPSNLMVTHYDGVPVPKIIDFGISKAIDKTLTEKTLFTSYGNMIGTPEYMSPEQAEMSGLDVDTRSDVYSLGVVLYELLTGTTPFYQWKKKGIHKFCQAICTEEPDLASTRVTNLASTVNEISRNRNTDIRSLNRFLRGDVDWILSKCMAKDRNRRYETASDLARDVQRYLNGQPIEAAGPRFGYRMGKFASKHRATMAIAAVMLISLVGATIVSTGFAFRATQSEKLANARLIEVDQLRNVAIAERNRAQNAEKRLQALERQSRNEVATSRAITRFRERFPDGLMNIKYPQRHHPSDARDPEQVRIVDSKSPLVVAPLPSVPENAEAISSVANNSVFIMHPEGFVNKVNIEISPTGELTIIESELVTDGDFTVGERSDNESVQLVLVGNVDNNDQTEQFLHCLAAEQKQLFGQNDSLVANTLFEMGSLALRKNDWPRAEKNLREVQEIFVNNEITDGRLAKVELFLGKALLRQDKIAAAKATLLNSLGNLDEMEEVSDEFVAAYEEMKVEFDKLDIPYSELGEMVKQKLGGIIQNAVKEHLDSKE